jgi:hypothetical protein
MEHNILKIVNERRSDNQIKTIKEAYDLADKYKTYALTQAMSCDKHVKAGLFVFDTPEEVRRDTNCTRYHYLPYNCVPVNDLDGKYNYEPYSAIGLNSMVAKIIEAIFPSTIPFFELEPSIKDKIELKKRIEEKAIQEVLSILQQEADMLVQTAMQTGQPVPDAPVFDANNPDHVKLLNSVFEKYKAQQRKQYNDYTLYAFDYFKKVFTSSNQYMSILLYLVTGAFLVYMPVEVKSETDARDKIKLIPIDRFNILDTPEGGIVQLCIKEQFHVDAVPDDLWKAIEIIRKSKGGSKQNEIITIYEMIRFKIDENGNRRYYREKEYDGHPLPETYEEGDVDRLPYLIQRPLLTTSSAYGASYISQLIPILEDATFTKNSLRSMVEVSGVNAMAVDTATLASNDIVDVMAMKNQLYSVANADARQAFNPIQFTFGQEINVIQNIYQESVQVIQSAFMQNSSAQRDSERTTKGEIMIVVEELKKRMSLTYTQLESFSGALIRRCIQQMTHAKLWDLKSKVEPHITVGIGRIDLNQKADMFIEMLSVFNQLLSQLNPVLLQSLDVSHFIDMVMASKGFQADMLLNSEAVASGLQEQQEQIQQQQQMMQMLSAMQGDTQPQG